MGIANKISAANRARKYNYFLQEIKPTASQTILDVGFSSRNITNEMNYLEKHYPYLESITALGVEDIDSEEVSKLYPLLKTKVYDGSIFPFEDNTFDIGWSNAVIEHVGDREQQVLFVKELLRTCKVVYFTTPNKKFPFELHTKLPFLHWLPRKHYAKCLGKLDMQWAIDEINLLTKKMILDICHEAGAKNIYIKKNRFFGFVMDFSIIVS